jgi:pentafunctional AROM polypeptide
MNFYLCGSPIAHSLSPIIHNTGFNKLDLPHIYDLYESLDIKKIITLLKNTATGGASITIPHKETIIPYLDNVSEEIKMIGAVNTIIKKNNKLIGHNTDWIGIKLPIEATQKKFASALILGAGGAARAVCYALNQLNIPFQVYNRTTAKAQKLAAEFNGAVCHNLNDHQAELVISTVPLTAKLELPESFWKPVQTLFDIVYKPYFTPLLTEAKKRNIQTIHGIEMLLEQAYEQFHLWTGKTTTKEQIKMIVYKNLQIEDKST